MTDQEIAEACAEVFWAGDRFSRGLGLDLQRVAPGRAVVRGAVGEAHLNVHDTAHGGFMFALGGAAFGLACNSHGVKAVAQSVDVIYSDRAVAGDVLVAEASLRHRAGKTGVYDIVLRREAGGEVALMRGMARYLSASYLDGA